MKKLEKTFSDLQVGDEVYYFNTVEQSAYVLIVESLKQYGTDTEKPLVVATFIDKGEIDDPTVDLDGNKSIMEYFDVESSLFATELFFVNKCDFIGCLEEMKENLIKTIDKFK